MVYQQLFKKYTLYHILLWAVLFVTWYLLRSDDFPGHGVAVKITIVKVLVLAALVYLTNLLLIPFFLHEKKYLMFALCFIAAIIFLGIFKVYLITQLLQPYYKQPLRVFEDVKERFYDNIIPLFLLVSTGAAAKLVMDYILSEKKLAVISREKAETELQYLRSQINPHFVFNTLNAIYFQIDKENQDARETLLQFADLLRYQLYECNEHTICIEKEMHYLEGFIQLQQKRKDGNYKVVFQRSEAVKDFQIAPLLLVPFVENAFKHISHFATELNIIRVEADMRSGTFHFTVVNTFEKDGVKEPDAGGIGLKNVQRRLELLYEGRHSLQINETKDYFTVDLAITI